MHEFLKNTIAVVGIGTIVLGIGWLPPILGVLWLRRIDINDVRGIIITTFLIMGGVLTAAVLTGSALHSWGLLGIILSVYACAWALGMTFVLHFSHEEE